MLQVIKILYREKKEVCSSNRSCKNLTIEGYLSVEKFLKNKKYKINKFKFHLTQNVNILIFLVILIHIQQYFLNKTFF